MSVSANWEILLQSRQNASKSANNRQKLTHKKSQPLKIRQLALFKVPRAGIEPARPFRAKGF